MNPSSKQSQAKKLIERYFYQLTTGCGRPDCKNESCYSSGLVDKLTANQAAIKAIQLYVEEAKICDVDVASEDTRLISPSPSASSSKAMLQDVEMTEETAKW